MAPGLKIGWVLLVVVVELKKEVTTYTNFISIVTTCQTAVYPVTTSTLAYNAVCPSQYQIRLFLRHRIQSSIK